MMSVQFQCLVMWYRNPASMQINRHVLDYQDRDLGKGSFFLIVGTFVPFLNKTSPETSSPCRDGIICQVGTSDA